MTEAFHHGSLGEIYEGIRVNTDDVVITAIKMAEDGDGAIVRCLETEGTSAQVDLRLLEKSISFSTTPYAIKTVNEKGEALNFMEWEMQA